MHILLVSVGIAGDNIPLIHWGRVLQQRGHDVTVIGNGAYRHVAEQFDVPFAAVISSAEHERRQVARGGSMLQALRSGVENLKADIPSVYREVMSQAHRGETLIAAHGMALGARIAQEKLGCRAITVQLTPLAFRSPRDPLSWSPKFPRFLIPTIFHVFHRVVDRRLMPAVNDVRKRAGLPPLRSSIRQWWHSPDGVLGFFPDWLAAPQPDWPPHTHLVGFPFPEADEAVPLPAHVEDFLQSGAPPLACSYTSGVATAGRFFTVLIDIARRTNRRMILISPPPELTAHSLPKTICVSSPIPHVDLFPRCAAAIHHGGIGTFANALAAGIPQLIVPFMHDQPEMARRAKALGVADAIDPQQFRAESAEKLLQHLLSSPAVQERCRDYAERCRQSRALDEASELLERFSSTSCITEPAHL